MFWWRFLGVFATRWCLRKSLGRFLHGVVVPPHAPFIQRPLISFAHLSPSLLILATRFNRGPGICFWSCHVGGRLPVACSNSDVERPNQGKGRTTQENIKQNTKLKDIKAKKYVNTYSTKKKSSKVDKQTKNNWHFCKTSSCTFHFFTVWGNIS